MKRLGFHYYQDERHYKQCDLDTWLPELISMNAGWLVLNAPSDRAIPEPFIKGLLAAEIEPVLHLSCTPKQLPDLEELRFLFGVYAKWGARYITFFHRPNQRNFWRTPNWARVDLVERFLDLYLPIAEACLECNLTPIFPPLEPGGDYWDTVFLRAALQGIKRRSNSRLLDTLILGAIAKNNGRSMNWGAGGPERWPDSLPYGSTTQAENHIGLRIYDWYQALIKSCLINTLPIFLFEVTPCTEPIEDIQVHTQNSLAIVKLLENERLMDLDPIPPEIMGAAVWLLCDEKAEDHSSMSWYQPGGETLPIVPEVKKWMAESKPAEWPHKSLEKNIKHYLLLPIQNNGDLEIGLEHIHPIIQKYKPTIGFSVDEAKRADRVTIVNINGAISPDTANQLRNAGCLVHQVDDMAQLLHL